MSKPIWIDAQLSPLLAKWITDEFNISCTHVRDVGLTNSTDKEIFLEARKINAIVITKDSDFLDLLLALESPPKIIWLTCGNTSNEKLKSIFKQKLPEALTTLGGDADLVEIT